MPRTRSKKACRTGALMVRLDPESKAALADAAELRGISVSDYVRLVTVAQARREVSAARGWLDQFDDQLIGCVLDNTGPRIGHREAASQPAGSAQDLLGDDHKRAHLYRSRAGAHRASGSVYTGTARPHASAPSDNSADPD